MAGLTITARVMKQKGQRLYLFSMNSKDLKELCYVTPKSHEDPEEVQRILNEKRAKEIGEYIKGGESSLLPNAIVVSLTEDVKIQPTGTDNEVAIRYPAQKGKFAYILDGQHRLAGFKHSDGVEFDMPIVALYNSHMQLRGKIFADINSKQVRVSDTHLLALYYAIKELPPEESSTMDVVISLAKDEDSPLRGKIKTMDSDTGAWVKNKHMKQCLAPHTETGGALHNKRPIDQSTIIKEFLKGIQQLWPEAWGDNRRYMLTRPMGIEIILGAFAHAKQRCDLNEGKLYTAETFHRQLAPLRELSIQIPGGGEIPLTWERGPFGILANKTGRGLIRKQLVDALVRADEPPA